MTLLDRRTFLARGAAGMLTVTALERLVARSALGATAADTAYGYGPIQPVPDQLRPPHPLAAGRVLVRDVRRDRLDDVRRQPHAAGARRHGGVPRTRRHGAADPQPRGPQPAGRRQRRRVRGGEVRHVRRRRHDDAGLRPGIADAGARLHLAERDDRELRRRVRARTALLAHRRGDDRRARESRPREAVRPPPRLPVRGAARPRPERAGARRAAERGRALLARGRLDRPAHGHRLRDRGSGQRPRRRLLPLHPEGPAGADRGRAPPDPRDPGQAALRRARGPDRRAQAAGPLDRDPRARSRIRQRRRPARHVPPGAGGSARRCSTGSRAAGTTRTTAARTSSRPAAATRRTATSTPMATARASARSGSTGRARAPAGC